MQTLSLIGAGRVGKPLAKLWHQQGELQINQVLTQSRDSAQAAVDFIGAGTVCASLSEMQPADFIFLAVPDDAILPICEKLAATALIQSDTVIFHPSGTVAANCLQPLSPHFASIHPVLSFANSDFITQHFSGTYCTLQGSESGMQRVVPIFQAIGANMVTPNNLQGALYHAGLVFLSNYLLPLLETGTECLQAAGIPGATTKAMVLPLIQSVLAQAELSDDWAQALTGPINRGDIATILSHLQSLSKDMPHVLPLYRELGQRAVGLATQQGLATETSDELNQLLERTS